jgi:hypothetical protein
LEYPRYRHHAKGADAGALAARRLIRLIVIPGCRFSSGAE